MSVISRWTRRHFLGVGAATAAGAGLGCALPAPTGAVPGGAPRLRTRVCDLLGIDYPIVQSGMGGVAGIELAAAVSEAGGLGILGAHALPPEQVRNRIREVRRRTDRPFGVNLLMHTQVSPPVDAASIPEDVVRAVQVVLNRFRERLGLAPTYARPDTRPDYVSDAIDVIIEEHVPVFSIGMGNPSRQLVDRFHAYGAHVIAMIATVDDARTVVPSGVDAIVAQGHEAGGHRSTWDKRPTAEHAHIGTLSLVPQVVEAVDLPVLASGGIASGAGIAAALALGAQGVLVGTRFVATRESMAQDFYKQALAARDSDATTVTDAFTGLYARALRTTFTSDYAASGAPTLPGYLQASAARDIYADAAARRDREYFPMWAGQGIGMIHDVPAAADVVGTLVRETLVALHALESGVRTT